MSHIFKWCKDKTRLYIWDRQVFYVDEDGCKWWYLNGQRHRENGPAVEYYNGNKYGYKAWYLNGKFHRVTGPAIEYVNGDKYWYLNNKEYSESNYWKEINK